MAAPPTATPTFSHVEDIQPYEPAGIINFISGLPRYGFGRDIRSALGGGGGSYLKGYVTLPPTVKLDTYNVDLSLDFPLLLN